MESNYGASFSLGHRVAYVIGVRKEWQIKRVPIMHNLGLDSCSLPLQDSRYVRYVGLIGALHTFNLANEL